MDTFRTSLAPLIDQLPPEVRDQLAPEVWGLILLGAALVLLLILWLLARRLMRALLGGKKEAPNLERQLREDLNALPVPGRPEGDLVLSVYHVPVRIRLVIVAPAGREGQIDATAVEKLLERLIPGLGKVVKQDRPRIRVWPAQLSHQGFSVAFHRATPTSEAEREPSRWIFLAGRAVLGKQPILLGLGLYAAEANSLGRINLEAHQWLDVLRLRSRGSG